MNPGPRLWPGHKLQIGLHFGHRRVEPLNTRHAVPPLAFSLQHVVYRQLGRPNPIDLPAAKNDRVIKRCGTLALLRNPAIDVTDGLADLDGKRRIDSHQHGKTECVNPAFEFSCLFIAIGKRRLFQFDIRDVLSSLGSVDAITYPDKRLLLFRNERYKKLHDRMD